MTALSDTSVKPASQGPRHTTAILAGVLGFSAFQTGVAFFPMAVVNFAAGHRDRAGTGAGEGLSAPAGTSKDTRRKQP